MSSMRGASWALGEEAELRDFVGHNWVPSWGESRGGPNLQGYVAVLYYPMGWRVSEEREVVRLGYDGVLHAVARRQQQDQPCLSPTVVGVWLQDGVCFLSCWEGAAARKRLGERGETTQSRGPNSSGGGTGYIEIKKMSEWEASEVVVVSNGW